MSVFNIPLHQVIIFIVILLIFITLLIFVWSIGYRNGYKDCLLKHKKRKRHVQKSYDANKNYVEPETVRIVDTHPPRV